MSALPAERQKRPYHRVHAGIRDGSIVLLKVCSKCGREGLCVDDPSSDFRPLRTKERAIRGWHSWCKKCDDEYLQGHRAAINERRRVRHAERMATDPEFRRRHNEASARANALWLEKPGSREKARAASREYHRRLRKEHPELYREMQRMDYALRQERDGKPVRHRLTVVDRTDPRVPADPFRRWFDAYCETGGLFADEAARGLGLQERYATRLKARKFKTTSVDIVSRALTNARFLVRLDGETIFTINDLYGEDFAIANARGNAR